VLTSGRGGAVTKNTLEQGDKKGVPQSPEALIEEARQRQRRRRLTVVIAVLVLASGVVIGLTSIGGSGGPRPRALTSNKLRAKHSTAPIPKARPETVATPPCVGNPQLDFANANDGWFAVGSGAILMTTDGGSHWTTSYRGPVCVSSFDFVNSMDGWALTNTPIVLVTTNGGKTWATAPAPGGYTLASTDFVTPTSGWAVTTTGHLMQSVNAGESWQPVPSPTGVYTVCGEAGGLTWLTLKDGDIVAQSPGATTWTTSLLFSQVPNPGGGITGDVFGSPEIGCFGKTVWALYRFVCGAGTCQYQVERSLDGGAQWTVVTPHLAYNHGLGGYNLGLGGVTSLSDAWFGGGTIYGENVLVTTNDTGATFHLSIVDNLESAHAYLTADSFVGTSQGWAIVVSLESQNGESSPAKLIGTDDGGATWHVISSIPGS